MSRAAVAPTFSRISGQVVLVSGQAVLISGQTIKVSGETVVVASGVYLASGIYVNIPTIPVSVSGQPIYITSGNIYVISGVVVAKVSGETLIAKVSGETVIGKISGEIVDIRVPTRVTSGGIFVVGAQSGGVILTSGPCVSVTIKALSTNSGDIYVAGNPLQSGQGFVLERGEAINLDVDNFGRVWLLAAVSGDRVTYVGVL